MSIFKNSGHSNSSCSPRQNLHSNSGCAPSSAIFNQNRYTSQKYVQKEDTVLLPYFFWSARAPFPLVNVINFSDPSAVTVRQLLKKLVTLSKLKPPPSNLQMRTFSSWFIRDHLNLTSFFPIKPKINFTSRNS